MKRLFWAATFASAAFVAGAARASHDYPRQIQGSLSLGYQPDCMLCHATCGCSDPRVVTDFGLSMMAFGAKGHDPASLEQALAAASARRWDSDGDGVPDIEELEQGTDPSGPALGRVPAPKHGCAVARGAAPIDAPLVVVLASLSGLVLAVRRRGSPRAR